MKKFTISRINTVKGIFKIKGVWHRSSKKIMFTELEIMSTDGWQPLDIDNLAVITLINLIKDNILQHLMLCE